MFFSCAAGAERPSSPAAGSRSGAQQSGGCRQSGAAPCSVLRGCGGAPPWLLSLGGTRLRTVPRCDALPLRILGRRCLYQGPHQRLIRPTPVTDAPPLRAVPLLELHGPTPFMIAAGEGERGDQALCPNLLDIGWREGEVLQPPLHLGARQGLVAKVAHGRPERLRGENALQHTTYPTCRADILCGPRPLVPGIDVLEHILDEREVRPRAIPDRADEAYGRLPGRHHVLLRAGRDRSHDLIAGDAPLCRFLQGGRGHDTGAP